MSGTSGCSGTLHPEAPIECFDVGFVRGLAGLGEVQRHAVRVGPQIPIPADELGALIDPERLRIADHGAGCLAGLDHVRRGRLQ